MNLTIMMKVTLEGVVTLKRVFRLPSDSSLPASASKRMLRQTLQRIPNRHHRIAAATPARHGPKDFWPFDLFLTNKAGFRVALCVVS